MTLGNIKLKYASIRRNHLFYGYRVHSDPLICKDSIAHREPQRRNRQRAKCEAEVIRDVSFKPAGLGKRDEVFHSKRLRKPHSGHIERIYQCLPQPYRAGILPVIINRRPLPAIPCRITYWFILYYGCRGQAFFQGKGINNGFKCRARLPSCVQDTVELTFPEIVPPRHCLYISGPGLNRNQGPLNKRLLLQRYISNSILYLYQFYKDYIPFREQLFKVKILLIEGLLFGPENLSCPQGIPQFQNTIGTVDFQNGPASVYPEHNCPQQLPFQGEKAVRPGNRAEFFLHIHSVNMSCHSPPSPLLVHGFKPLPQCPPGLNLSPSS